MGICEKGAVDWMMFSTWLRQFLMTRGQDIFRSKGVLNISGSDRRFVFQGVHMLLDGGADRPWGRLETRENRLVFIGRNLNREELTAAFKQCLA